MNLSRRRPHFGGTNRIWTECDSFVEWRRGTGDNVELTNIRVSAPRRGIGRALFVGLLNALCEDPPYRTIYGFALADRPNAVAFYKAMGFNVTRVDDVYEPASGTCLFVGDYKELCKLHGVKL